MLMRFCIEYQRNHDLPSAVHDSILLVNTFRWQLKTFISDGAVVACYNSQTRATAYSKKLLGLLLC